MTVSNAALNTDTSSTAALPLVPPVKTLDQYSFFQALRAIERQRNSLPRIGYARRPADEPVRIGHPAELTFAPSTMVATSADVCPAELAQGQSPTDKQAIEDMQPPVLMQQRFLGLLGPGGPLPLHVTETVRDRRRHAGDDSLQAFLDIFHHRTAMLFYRAWSDAQGIVQHDRPDADKFGRFLGALAGDAARADKSAESFIKRFHAGQFAGQHRHAEGLSAILTRLLGARTRVESFALRTLELASDERTTLSSQPRGGQRGRASNCLGRSAQLGKRVADRSSMIDIRIGPVDLPQFQQLQSAGTGREVLTRIVRDYAGAALDARVTVNCAVDKFPKRYWVRLVNLAARVGLPANH